MLYFYRPLSPSSPGSKHDRKLFSHSGAAAKIPPETTVGGDCGYQGIQDDLPDHSVITPFKKSKHYPLIDEQKRLNQEFARGRIIVENTIRQFKHFAVLAQRFRHDVDKYDDAFRSVLAIVNPRIQKRVAAAAMT
ncbi:MAG: transposase [Anaerolineae bacterium]|nr:transposase [Anaerolineae bacterium]